MQPMVGVLMIFFRVYGYEVDGERANGNSKASIKSWLAAALILFKVKATINAGQL